MRTYAQTYPQLLNQLRDLNYSSSDLTRIRNVYELAMQLFSGRFQASGKVFIAHVVGTASVLASVRSSADLVAAGLIHNAYGAGDFGDGCVGVTPQRRERILKIAGAEVEQYVARFPSLTWNSARARLGNRDRSGLNSVDRGVLLIRIADHLEHLCDLDLLYYEDRRRHSYLKNSRLGTELAADLGIHSLANEMRERIEEVETGELPVELPANRIAIEAFVISRKSIRKRFGLRLRETLWSQRQRVKSCHQAVKNMKTSFATRINEIVHPSRKGHTYVGRLVGESKTFTSLFADGGRIERVATGFQFTEGPVWIAEENSLVFSDIPANRIFRFKSDLSVEIFREPSGNSNGLTRDRTGCLIACEQSNRRVTRTEKDGSITVLANTFEGRRLNSPNDVVVKSDGSVYFSDPAYGVTRDQKEQPVEGVYRISPDGRHISLIAADFERPNGLAFSPDETTLYIDDSARRHVVAFNIRSDGSLCDRRLFHDMDIRTPGAPDGMKVDADGRLYCTGAGGVWVFDAQGRHLGTIVTPEKPSNCAWGDEDRRSLYITAISSVYKIRVRTPGIGT
jgi:gluconolactonase